MGGPGKYIESMKTALIVALFISAMLLLYFFWENPTLPAFNFSEIISEEAERVPLTEEVIRPQQVTVNFGTGVSTAVAYNVADSWNQGMLALRKFSNSDDLALEVITKEQYEKIMQFRSVSFSFLYSLPFDSFCQEYRITKNQSFSQIKSFSLLAYSAGSPESLFLVDETTEQYYRVISAKNMHTLEPLIASVEEEDYVAYYPIGTFLGTTNQTVMPLAYYTKMQSLEYSAEFDRTEESKIKNFAQKFFGESLDFVRRIEESKGTLIYMYGYGQKVLTVFPEGSIEYKEESGTGGDEQTYFEALNTGLEFVSAHGGWEPFEGQALAPYLRYSETVKQDKKTGYRFVFGIKTNGEDLFYESGDILTVEILNGQVTSYKRNLINAFIPEDSQFWEERETFSPVNMLAQNYNYLYSLLRSEGYTFKQAEGDALFDEVSELIDQVKLGYVRQDPTDGSASLELQPAWVIIIDDMEIYFDLFEAIPLGHNKIGAV